MVAHLHAFRTFWQSLASLPSRTTSSYTLSYSGVAEPQICSRARLPPFCQNLRDKQTNLAQHQDEDSLTLPGFSELTWKAPEVFPHPCCRNLCATSQKIAKDGCAGTLRTLSYNLQKYMKMHYIHRKYLHRNTSRWCSSVIGPSFLREGCNLIKVALFASTASWFPAVSESRIKTYVASNFTSNWSSSWKHTECFSHLTDLRYSRGCQYTFTVAKVAAQVFRTGPLALGNLNTTSFIYSTKFCSSLSNIFFLSRQSTHWIVDPLERHTRQCSSRLSSMGCS